VPKKRPRRRPQEIHGPFCLDSLFASLDGGSTLVAEETTYGEEFQRGSQPPPPASPDPSVDEEDRKPDDPCRLMEWRQRHSGWMCSHQERGSGRTGPLSGKESRLGRSRTCGGTYRNEWGRQHAGVALCTAGECSTFITTVISL
jgi:hypothetical protein